MNQQPNALRPFFADSDANDLVTALQAASSATERDVLLSDYAEKQGFLRVLDVAWDYYHLGKLAEIAEQHQFSQLAEIFRFAWKIDDAPTESNPSTSGEEMKLPEHQDPLEFRKVLVLSTSHLTKETCLEYKAWPFIAEYEEGCYFYVGDEPDLYIEAPDDLKQVLVFAKQHGCVEVKFDQDADLIAKLPTYDWERTSQVA